MSRGFWKGDHIVPRRFLGTKHQASEELVVDGFKGERLRVFASGGGFVGTLLPGVDEREDFVLVNPDIPLLIYASMFTLEGHEGELYAGWTTGRLWNGWATAYFPLVEALRIAVLTNVKCIPDCRMEYHSRDDEFCLYDEAMDDEDGPTRVKATKLFAGGMYVQAYDFSNFGWCFTEVDDG